MLNQKKKKLVNEFLLFLLLKNHETFVSHFLFLSIASATLVEAALSSFFN